MPELPEVETTRRGIAPHITARTVSAVVVREPRLRWPVPEELGELLIGGVIQTVDRRAKYLLLRTERGSLIIHLGMSGSLRIVPADTVPRKHDHVDLVFDDGLCLRFHDPRRFGCILWTADDPLDHVLLASLGPEPLGASFSGDDLYRASRGSKTAIKPYLMDGKQVVGVGNIYASEALFRAGIHPQRKAGAVGLDRYRALADAIRAVLSEAIAQGGTTLRDFVNESGSPGYFQQTLNVYGREGEPCRRCGAPIRQLKLGQRASYYCAHCQR
ncbi:bifunctional DNA-formamidopyrimidine glycosylase/DNA-(apurinic or apyrimidinic site) lyase [Methylococcus sp. EFPC2]|uniref:bifunctional DNA-formamidopyrimidine glycosylase/DNA-(apurinic or apyrimidinic site) lyase n=1 Tax=Methylococcus sp. EFPC2 TaxID=2812648 RepID=UPI0019680D73|nr:bifunctional DNA-formamidopyrimidine glycosylase/DNA-(apurinic or apyrimidinic site) lyase [Methylococcus sp. EFPC2]QSA96463.1 bifunctional DNA-formamidopyrimidine glycosylase/DNA-(apurinic or apyrimidinic site) lyase [Methylococcus sp. EFPC2]